MSHSIVKRRYESKNAIIEIVPYLSDNYGYFVIDKASNETAIVDCGDAERVESEFDRLNASSYGGNLVLKSILTTHHHWDHAGGNAKLIERVPTVSKVYGGRNEIESVQGLTDAVSFGDSFTVGTATHVDVIETPCHTAGHVMYVVDGEHLFTGDTLFRGGVGRFFEGSSSQMANNLTHVLKPFGDSTLVWCGHEYSAENYEFAKWARPDDADVVEESARIADSRSRNEATVPSTLGQERKTNVFFVSDVAEMKRLREAKNDGLHRVAKV